MKDKTTMNREIKFRGLRTDRKTWVYGDYFKTPLTDENSGTDPSVGWFFLTGQTRHCIGSNVSCFVIDEKTLGQSTGLLDKNGKEMYGGDIVVGHNTIGVIEWCNELAGWALVVRDIQEALGEEFTMTVYSNQRDGKNIHREIIGNIHEHPHLLQS